MGPFGKDPFEDDPFDIFRRFFGESDDYSNGEVLIKGEEEERIIDFINTPKKIYIVFELFGYDPEDVSVSVSGRELEVVAKRKRRETDDEYVSEKLAQGKTFQKILPKFVKTKNFKKTFKNGVLELCFDKK